LGDEHIRKVVRAYKEFSNEDGFSKAVEIDKVKENDFNLNVTLYVFPEEETEEIDVAKEWDELRTIEKEIFAIEEKIEGYLRELK
jgi:type I restriction enzyme M protein